MTIQSQGQKLLLVGVTAKRDFPTTYESWRAPCWDTCTSSSGTYFRASTTFDRYEGIIFLEITWCVRPIADTFTGTRLIGDQATYGAKCSQFNFHHGWRPQSAIGVLIKLSSFIDPTRKPVSPPPYCSQCDALVQLSRPPLWPNWDASWEMSSLDMVNSPTPGEMMGISHQC